MHDMDMYREHAAFTMVLYTSKCAFMRIEASSIHNVCITQYCYICNISSIVPYYNILHAIIYGDINLCQSCELMLYTRTIHHNKGHSKATYMYTNITINIYCTTNSGY